MDGFPLFAVIRTSSNDTVYQLPFFSIPSLTTIPLGRRPHGQWRALQSSSSECFLFTLNLANAAGILNSRIKTDSFSTRGVGFLGANDPGVLEWKGDVVLRKYTTARKMLEERSAEVEHKAC